VEVSILGKRHRDYGGNGAAVIGSGEGDQSTVGACEDIARGDRGCVQIGSSQTAGATAISIQKD
jgi:hypothetical protein